MSEPLPPTPTPPPTPPPPLPPATAALVLHPKTTASGLGGALVLVILYFLDAVWNISPPPEVAAAMTVIVGTAFAYAAPRLPSGTP